MTTASISKRDTANVQATVEELAQFLVQCRTREGFDDAEFRKLLGKHRAQKFDNYLSRSGRVAGELLAEVSLDAKRLQDLAMVIAPQATRQSLGERESLALLRTGLSATFFQSPVYSLPSSGKAAFLACPDIAKRMDFAGASGQATYVFAHKCTNNGGGSQDASNAELDRMALAATFPSSRYDGFVLRSPERVLSRIVSHFGCERAALVLLQDGRGRENDLARIQAICARENHLARLYVFADTTENFILMQPLIHARLMGGEQHLSAGQRAVFDDAVAAFREKFPQGRNGFQF